MKLLFTVEVDVQKIAGKYVSRDEIVEVLLDELNNAQPADISVDESDYEVLDWSVSEATPQELIKQQNHLIKQVEEPKS